jgi:hypothetical protein
MKNLLLRFPLAFIIFVEFLFLLYLVLSRKIPLGHDGFQYFSLQYYFLNNSIQNSEIAQWMPYMTHGTVANWWYYVQGSPLQSLWMLTGGLLSSANFFYIYYSGIFVDLLLLTCGVWVLGSFFYQSIEAKFIATSTAVISCLWFDQPWFNLHLFYLIPLTLFFFLKFFNSHKTSDLLIAGNISALQLFGALPYFAPVISFTIFIFLASYLLTHMDKAKLFWSHCLKSTWVLPIFCFLLLAPLACCWILLQNGTSEILNHNLGRNLDGTVSLQGFLTYGRSGWSHWHEIFSGFSPALDFSIYFGIFPLAAILFFLTHKVKKTVVPILTTTILLILFAEGTFFSIMLYHFWPGMDYYRHLTSSLPIVKFFLCLLSGFAVDQLLNSKIISKNRIFSILILLFAGFAFTLYFYKFPSVFSEIRPNLKGLPSEPSIWTLSEVSLTFLGSAIIYLIAGFIFFFFLYSDRKDIRKKLVWICLLFTLTDLCYFQLSHAHRRLTSLNPSQYQQLSFQSTLYPANRTIEPNSTDRVNAFQNYMESFTKTSRSAYSTTESFLFQDIFSSPYLTDHWLRPLDLLMRAGHGFPSLDPSVKPPYMEPKKFIGPNNNKKILMISGVSRDKLVLFETAYMACTEEDASRLIRHPDYDGNLLILNDPNASVVEGECQTSEQILQSHSKIPSDITPAPNQPAVKVLSFSSNTLHLEVENSLGKPKANWLYYADTWHPLWKAQVNEKEVKVFQANLAYKAVRLEPGKNDIEFRFGSQQYNMAALTISLNWLFLLGIAVVYSGRSLFRRN